MFRTLTLLFLSLILSTGAVAQKQLLIPMNASQTDHLKAYGIIFNNLQDGNSSKWLLNYQGGSFMTAYSDELMRKCRLKNVKAKAISASQAADIIADVQQQDANTSVINLDKAPKIAVYTPKQAMPWDDAVTLVLNYAGIEYNKVWDPEVLNGELSKYDWLHLHHEDFTGQYGKFWGSSRNQPWYINQVKQAKSLAHELGYQKVSNEKKAVAANIKKYISNGGFMFSMCSGTDTFDIALAAQDVDIAPQPFDGDPMDPNAQQKLNFDNTLAFTDFTISKNPSEYEHANIDVPIQLDKVDRSLDFFTLFEFSAKWDPVPTMLTQNHVSSIRGFYGQTTAFQKDKVKESVVILGESPGRDMVKYVHGNYGRGTFTFYAGHDPEDYTHRVNDPPTDLSLHPSSPGYRLILNNILFPAAKKKKRKT
ncbi:hypothetical protein LX73_0275 [Fodinibius salinus]|uniref:Asparagine synthetase B n=1 Tax=Fodinibius salinus TaxID=860790 RepID=A0A5D3YR10_9BACT|nr:asparagine synthetase B [Fodinibius salinus]TYP94981.1 hypothetical protein LX73_0275 [Fodinibius salinus]